MRLRAHHVKEKKAEWGGKENPDDGDFFFFFETKDVFQRKDLEELAPKEKGITAVSVKEVLQSLVGDGMTDCERIGTSNSYWAFQSKALHARKCKLEAQNSQLSEGSQKQRRLREEH